ncbi:hypothetical protein OHA70_11080 [Kribbella sp. NBC_00382]|uniref:hypothetical protein n=1 Tax=Kribbella sp. NBC_00382 TaxID=2975967 RepID=UPI002E1A553A
MSILVSRRISATLLAGLAGTALLLTPAAAASSVTATTTDRSGDARIVLRNVPTADLLSANAQFDESTVTVSFGLGAAPTAAQLATGNYTFTSTIAPGLFVRFDTEAHLYGDNRSGEEEPTAACLAYFGPEGPGLSTAVLSGATTLSATFRRADVNAAATCFHGGTLGAGSRVQVVDAASEYRDPPRGLFGGGIARDTAASGAAVTLAN